MTLTDLLANLEDVDPQLDLLAVGQAIAQRLRVSLTEAIRLTWSWDTQANFIIARFPKDYGLSINVTADSATVRLTFAGVSTTGQARDARKALLTAILRADRELKLTQPPV